MQGPAFARPQFLFLSSTLTRWEVLGAYPWACFPRVSHIGRACRAMGCPRLTAGMALITRDGQRRSRNRLAAVTFEMWEVQAALGCKSGNAMHAPQASHEASARTQKAKAKAYPNILSSVRQTVQLYLYPIQPSRMDVSTAERIPVLLGGQRDGKSRQEVR